MNTFEKLKQLQGFKQIDYSEGGSIEDAWASLDIGMKDLLPDAWGNDSGNSPPYLPVAGVSAKEPARSTKEEGWNPTLPHQYPDVFLEFCSRTDVRYVAIRNRHYVKNKGAHARQVHFLVWYKGRIVGIISGSSCAYATPARDKFFGISSNNREKVLPGIISNTVFRLEDNSKNLATMVLAQWRKIVPSIWESLYGTKVFGFETFVIPDRTGIMEGGTGSEPRDSPVENGQFKSSIGTLYKADNWTFAGMTEGSTKKDNHGMNESSQRQAVFPKVVWCKWRDGFSSPLESKSIATWRANQKWNEKLERQLKRSDPDITEEKWRNISKYLKAEAHLLASRRKEYLGEKFFAKGKLVCFIKPGDNQASQLSIPQRNKWISSSSKPDAELLKSVKENGIFNPILINRIRQVASGAGRNV